MRKFSIQITSKQWDGEVKNTHTKIKADQMLTLDDALIFKKWDDEELEYTEVASFDRRDPEVLVFAKEIP